jgi:glucose/arabinose dehydrogenase
MSAAGTTVRADYAAPMGQVRAPSADPGAPAARVRVASLAAALAACVLGVGCGGKDERAAPSAPPPRTGPERAEKGPVRSEGGPRVESVATGLAAPWELSFLPDGRALLTERPGRVRLLSRDLRLRPGPVAQVDVAAIEEGGLLGLAVDPRFERNRFVYLYRTTQDDNEVVRYRFAGERLKEQAVILRGIAAGPIHDAGRIHFGPDGRLYVPTGDAGQDTLAQDRGSLNGKVLRMDPEQYRGEGGRPEVFSRGHRNPQGFAWQPRSGRLYASEHGPDGDDEVNLLRQGANYGWPEARGADHDGFAAPLAVYTPAIAPSGATFVRQPGSAWSGDFLVGCLIGEQVRRLRFDGSRVTRNEALFEGDFGRIRTVVEGPDGALYLLTSNRDGRGTPGEGDDRVLRVVPPAA